MGLIFEWDGRKAKDNLRKHGVSFETASRVFGDFRSLTVLDVVHSDEEQRFLTIGRSAPHQVLVVVHSDRGDHMRIISARPATKHERSQYEKNT